MKPIKPIDLAKIIDQIMYQTEVQTLSYCISLLGSRASRKIVEETLRNRLTELKMNKEN